MTADAGDALVRALHDHNPWWDDGTAAFSLPARQKSDFYHLARPDEPGSQFEDHPILGLAGRRGAGKTTLLHQFIHHRIETGGDPEQFLYLPFDADPLYQLQSDDQLSRAVRYYENRVLADTDSPHFLLLDDVHQIEHPNKNTIDGWGTPVADLIDAVPNRHIAVTASAGIQIERELERAGMDENTYRIQPILPEKFRDYIFSLYPDLESGETRVSPTTVRKGPNSLPAVVRGDPIEGLVSELRSKYEQIATEDRRIQSHVVDYLAAGGVLSYAVGGATDSADALQPEDYARLREDVRDALYQDVPGFESIQTIGDLERLCALAAQNAGRTPIEYKHLVDLFDVDRRTIVDSYLPALETLYLMTGVTEYNNSRPRATRLYLRDTGLLTALTDGDAASVLSDYDREADVARVAAFDHTMRFAYNLNAIQGRDDPPTVQYWEGSDGEVDYVFEVDDTPIPVALAYRSSDQQGSLAALHEFIDTFDAPVGFLLAGDTLGGQPIELLDQNVIQLPYWFYLLLC